MPPKRQNPNEVLGLARRSLAAYAPLMFPRFELAWHHSRLIAKLEAVERGEIRRLMVFMPPRHGKTLLATQVFPSWFLGRNPEKSIICATYAQDLADDFGRVVRGYVNDNHTKATFSELGVAEDSNSMKRFVTTAGGAYYAVGRGAAITGRGADLLLVDDPLKDADEARSENIRHSLHEWFGSVAYTRLQPQGAIVLIQTRWHHDDLAGWLLREHGDEGWNVLSLPAIAEVDGDGRREGEALWPRRFSAEALRGIRAAVGGSAWSALYQQRPSAVEGEIFKREWWKRYTELPPKFRRIVQSWDTAFKTGKENDFSVCTTWGESENGFYLLDRWSARCEFPELKRKVTALAQEWRPNVVLVEDKASGQSLIQELQASTRFPVLAIKVDSDKVSRANAASPLVECGKVFLPQSAPWLADFLYSMCVFPAGAHDDDVDSCTQALNYMRGSNLSLGLIDYYKKLAAAPLQIPTQLAAKVEEKPEECEACGSTELTKLPHCFRCQQCGAQFGQAAMVAIPGQTREVRTAWRM